MPTLGDFPSKYVICGASPLVAYVLVLESHLLSHPPQHPLALLWQSSISQSFIYVQASSCPQTSSNGLLKRPFYLTGLRTTERRNILQDLSKT
jgi:hypothetical protein